MEIIKYIKGGNIEKLYFEKFRAAQLKRGFEYKTIELNSFFSKLVHTFDPENYCALDNPIKNHFKLTKESFYLSFLIISSQYKKWAQNNQLFIKKIKDEFKLLDTEEIIKFDKLTDLKLLDLIFWSKAN